ncbi:MAG: ribosome maturation factor RimP [Ignavibacteria bacterium]|nr:ribosome maturation factor RimP [Ignavibacteria bacterium]
MAEFRQKLKELVEPLLERHGAYLVDLALRHERGTRLVEVFADTDKGITIEECAEISRDLGRQLETQQVFDRAYRLEVSSPGLDKPLRLLRQYRKNIGRRYRVDYASGQERKRLIAKLDAVSGTALTFVLDSGDAVTLDFSIVIEAKEELPW